MKPCIITDPDHEWYGKEIEILANPGRGIMNMYIVRLIGCEKKDAITADQWCLVEDFKEKV